MARTPAQRGRTGNWLLESRLARGWHTQERAREEIQRLTGWLIPQSVYAEWESGRRVPSEANLGRLQQFYGTEQEKAPTVSGEGELAAAIRAQTEVLLDAITARDDAIERLLRELAEYRAAAVEAQTVERSLIESLPQALAIALAATRANDPAPELPGAAQREAQRV